MPKLRLDKLLVDRALVQSRERAQAMILAGRVLVNEQKCDKPGAPVAEDVVVRLLGDDIPFVSRGGLKLEGALRMFAIELEDRSCADIGASTGGFTDCMLQRGARSVVAVDTGYGQIAHKLRVDPRVTLLERTNARKLMPGSLTPVALANGVTAQPADGFQEAADYPHAAPAHASGDPLLPITFFAMDVSFISSTLVLPAVLTAFVPAGERWQGEGVMLVKPQFEAGREHIGKGGIVRDPAAHQLAIDRVAEAVRSLGGEVAALIDSPILGMEGNKEFLLHARFAGR